MEKVCFIFKNNKEANFYFKEVKMKIYNREFVTAEKERIIVLPNLRKMSFIKRILTKLHLYVPDAEDTIFYLFKSKNTDENLNEYEKYYFLDDTVDYIPQFMEIMF